MNHDAYLRDPDVVAFLEWASPFVTGGRPLDHCWTSPKWGTRQFKTLFDAYENYEWKFSVGKHEGKNYAETVAFLDGLRERLRTSVEQGDDVGFCEAVELALRWGHVYQKATLSSLGAEAMFHLTENARRLHPAKANLDRLVGLKPMSAGFSKVYSLLIPAFPIYDSRVACAIASLVRLFCHESCRDAVPEMLQIEVPIDRATICRDPSCRLFRFRRISSGSATRYARSNVMAAWLLGKMAEQPPFSKQRDPLHALQSAMFMVGYAPLACPCPCKPPH